MHVPINVKSPNNISEWQMGFNSAFKGLRNFHFLDHDKIRKHDFTKMKAIQVTHLLFGRLINKLELLKPESNLNDI